MRHGAARQNPLTLAFRAGRDNNHGIDALLAAGFEQQRDIHHHDGSAGALGFGQEFLAGGAEHRVNDLLKLLDGGRIVHHLGGKFGAIDLAVDGGAGKRGFHRGRRLAFIDFVNRRICVIDRDTRFHKQFCGGGFSHSDRAGQSEDPHQGRRFLKKDFQIPSSRSRRKNASKGSSGRPRMVK